MLGYPTKMKELDAFEKKLCAAYEMHTLGELKWFLGIRIIRDRSQRKIWLCQDSYIKKLATRFGVKLEGKHPKTPLSCEKIIPNSSKDVDEKVKRQYQKLVGSLNYAAWITRGGCLKQYRILQGRCRIQRKSTSTTLTMLWTTWLEAYTGQGWR